MTIRILQKAGSAYELEGIVHLQRGPKGLQNCTEIWQKAVFVCFVLFVFLSNCSRFSPKRYVRPRYPNSNLKQKL